MSKLPAQATGLHLQRKHCCAGGEERAPACLRPPQLCGLSSVQAPIVGAVPTEISMTSKRSKSRHEDPAGDGNVCEIGAEPNESTAEGAGAGDAVLAASPLPAGRANTKSATVLAMLRSTSGASLAEIMTATGWQAHSVRGFLSGTVRKRMALLLTCETTCSGERRYRLGADAPLDTIETTEPSEPVDIPAFLLKSKATNDAPGIEIEAE
jgi:hypothetical protein